MSPATILLVDDDEVLSQVLRRVLTREGYQVIEAGSIAQALEAARTHPPVLALLDLSLPDGDGIELARKLRAQGTTCPFILVTAYPLRLRDQPELSGAFTRILTKPLNLQDLRQAIDAALAGAGSVAASPPDSAAGPATLRPPPADLPAPPAPPAAAPPPRVRLRGLLLGGVILAGLAFFVLLVVLPALGFPGIIDWFGKSAPPTAPAEARGPAGALVETEPDTLRLAPDVAAGLGVKTEQVSRPKTMETLTLSGSLNLDPDYLAHVHPRFQGEVIEIGPYLPPGSTPTAPTISEPKRALRFGDQVRAGQLLAVLWSKDLGEKKNDLIEALAKLWTDQESLARLEDLYKDLATSEANVRLQRSVVAADLSAVDRARNALRIWRLSEDEVKQVESDAKDIYDKRIQAVKSGDKASSSGGDWTRWARLEVKAPFDGTIVERNVAGGYAEPKAAGAAPNPGAGKDPAVPNIGELVDVSQDLFKIADMTHLVVWAYAYEQDLPALRAMQGDQQAPIPWTVQVTADPADPNGRDQDIDSPAAYEVGPIIDPNQHTALVIGKAANPDLRYKAGQFVTASIPVPPPDYVVAVPADAVVEDGSESIVFVQPDPNTPQYAMRRVKVYRRLPGWIYVLSSEPNGRPREAGAPYGYLQKDDRVVTEGAVVLKSTLEDLQERKKAEK